MQNCGSVEQLFNILYPQIKISAVERGVQILFFIGVPINCDFQIAIRNVTQKEEIQLIPEIEATAFCLQ